MPITVAELKELPDNKTVLVAAGGRIRPLERVITNDQMSHVVLAVKEPARKSQRFAPEELQFLIGAVSFGIPIDAIAELLSRDVPSLQRKLKAAGVSYVRDQ